MLPEKFICRMKDLLGDEFQSFIDAHEKVSSSALRLNYSKLLHFEPEKIVSDFSCTKINGFSACYRFDYLKPGNHPYHHAGAFYIQEPSAMAPVSSLEGLLPNGIKVLDACAAPGGKTTQAAGVLSEDSVIVSNEIVPSRCKVLVGNIERLGLKNIIVLNSDTEQLSRNFAEKFALVICDAPCSGEGMFRKSEQAVSDWSEENVTMCAKRQKEILDNVCRCVCSGGYLLYSTCTYSPEENEMNVEYFLENHADFELCNPGSKYLNISSCGIDKYCKCFDKEYVRRFYPHIWDGEGQFFALFRKKGELACDPCGDWKDASRSLTIGESTAVESFLKETVGKTFTNIRVYGTNIVILPEGLTVPSNRVFSCGVKLGEYKNGRIVPHHQFFSAFGGDFKRQISFSASSEQIVKYLHGEGFEVQAENGWASVLVDGIPVGGAKIVDGYLKNHYPKGLRIMKTNEL